MERAANKVSGYFGAIVTIALLSGWINVAKAEYNPTTRFAAIGHTYAHLNAPEKRAFLIDKLNRDNVDMVFILGDADCWNMEIADEYRNGIEAQVFFVPGNHDTEVDRTGLDRMAAYNEHISYTDTLVQIDNYNFLLINSSADGASVKEQIWKHKDRIENEYTTTILLAHHRVWDDNLLSNKPYDHDKSYTFEDLGISGINIQYIFAGNSPRQYFGNQYCSDAPTNPDIVYWLDMAKDIQCYSVGSHNGVNVSYVVGELTRANAFKVYPRSFTLPAGTELAQPLVNTSEPPVLAEPSLFARLLDIGLSTRFLAGMAVGMTLLLASIIFRLKRKKE